MPRRQWTQADYNEAYGSFVPIPGLPLSRKVWRGYGRHLFGFAEQVADTLIRELAVDASSRVLVIGAGFGWVVEALEDRVPGIAAVGTDTSAWIQAEKGNTEDAELDAQIADYTAEEQAIVRAHLAPGQRSRDPEKILNETGASGQSRARIRQALAGSGPILVVIDDVDPGLDDAEAIALSAVANQIGDTVVHIVTEDSPGKSVPDYNWKTGEAWKSLIPGDLWIPRQRQDVVL